MQIDLAKGESFKFIMPKEKFEDENKEFFEEYFDGYEDVIDYQELKELYQYIINQIQRITEYVNEYQSYGKKITKHTKLYDIIDYLQLQEQAKQSNTIDENSIQQIADQLKHYITQPNTISDTKGKRKTPRQMIEADRLKKALKRKSKD